MSLGPMASMPLVATRNGVSVCILGREICSSNEFWWQIWGEGVFAFKRRISRCTDTFHAERRERIVTCQRSDVPMLQQLTMRPMNLDDPFRYFHPEQGHR